ncbi:MOSC domain-containing protein [Mycolicibacterium arseniciresistens]|uniref:MOSC domain-containing protein n=1 Tax=Mycolicibacterium arseniciresistens TaxID=3062257 RepID=A0ABT8UI16_9MYCO|nr:MOSC domain-containing protein [Mycolicibacterium arseniciresistens]MDO3637443.1 MOSC domain-containing protein [Mycolicibacterium arseniciresistens]
MSHVLSVNVARPRANPAKPSATTGIDKAPSDGAVLVQAPGSPGPGSGSGLAGDIIGNGKLHGGGDQAVYAYAREDLDNWSGRLDRQISDGMFGENLTTSGVDVTTAVIGERWRIGSDGLVLELTAPRTPCKTFAAWLEIPGLIKTFTAAAVPGAYFRVITPGHVRAGDSITVTDRPDHGVTVQTVFRALLTDPSLLDGLQYIDALAEDIKRKARRRAERSA